MYIYPGNDEKTLLQSADLAILLTSSLAENGVGGEVDGVDPTRNPGKVYQFDIIKYIYYNLN